MADETQTKKGYLRGVRGVLLTRLNEDGSMPEELDRELWWVDTAQEVDVAAEIVAGESADLRGGDRLLLRIEEDDVIVGATLTFRDARFDAKAAEFIGGGTLIVDPLTDEILGWDAPTVEEQATKDPFQAEVYVQSYNEAGGREAYLKYTFRYCKGNPAEVSHSGRSWGTPEFTIKARENPATLESTHKKEFVDELPEAALEAS
jgi:hypothetical protein